jgi:hypothetical protein
VPGEGQSERSGRDRAQPQRAQTPSNRRASRCFTDEQLALRSRRSQRGTAEEEGDTQSVGLGMGQIVVDTDREDVHA